MMSINRKKLFKNGVKEKIIIFMASIVLIYLLISLYFDNHFFFNTVINGSNVSLKAHNDVSLLVRNYMNDYKLQLIERNGGTEEITGQMIDMQYNNRNSISKIYPRQNPFYWLSSVFKEQQYYVNDLISYNKGNLKKSILELDFISQNITEPQNVSFKYSNGLYNLVEEVYGNKIIMDKLNEAIKLHILMGKTVLDLNEAHCYENPKYTINSDKALITKNLLNKYVSTIITYKFGSDYEMVDGNMINEWLSVDENLDVAIDKSAITNYVNDLCDKYNTVGITRKFETSIGKTVEVKGGLYGWKIDLEAEVEALLKNISLGDVMEKEPIYTQKALSREENEIGNTYIEINITRQHLWFYQDGKLKIHGSVVTGNPNRGNATVLGTYMLNYKQKDTTLVGPGYEVKVTYWMPFFGNMGLHDASWRYTFGGDIYKRKGTHGCVNAPFYLAKTIFENIEEGIPIICYEE